MAIEVKLDQLEGATTRRTLDGWEVHRSAYVSGLSGDYHQRMTQAITASGMPQLREAHPQIPGIFVTSIDAAPAGIAAAMVRIVYGSQQPGQLPAPDQPPQIEVGATLSQTSTHQTAAGDPIIVTLGEGSQAVSQVARVSRLSPQVTVRYTRLEEASPGSKARDFVGRINADEVFSSDVGTWMCTAITGRSADGGSTYEVTYDFQYNPDGWNPQVAYIDPATGQPHAEAESITAVIYESVDFADLEL